MANKFLRQMFWSVNRHFFAQSLKRQFNFQYDEQCDPLPDSPFIMVSNHANFFDPWMVAHPSPRPVSIMMNEEGFKAPPVTRWYLDKIGAFPKRKGGTDVRAMKMALKRLSMGYPLLIFPEGQTSWDGETQPIYAGIEKLILRSKLPLVLVNLSGNFISRPWWSTNDRKGAVIVSRKVIPVEKLAEMKVDEIREEITNYIYNNDCKNEKLADVVFKSDTPAKGLNRLLWKCPACSEENKLSFTETSVTCGACDKTITVNPNLTVTPTNSVNDIHDWVSLQKEAAKIAIESATAETQLLSAEGIRLVDVDYSGRVITLDTGILELTKTELIYNGEHGKLTFGIHEITQPVFQQKDIIHFEKEGGGETRLFIEGDTLYKWLTYLRYLTGYAESEMMRYYQ